MTDVIMPQMGESIFEGTITKWLKKVGDKVQRDEPLFEISTDKVDAEIPAPASGVLQEIKASEGSTVQVNTVVAVIGGAGAPAKAAPIEAAPTPKPVERPPAQPTREQVIDFPATDRAQQGGERLRSSPLVRRIAREGNINLEAVPGTGLGGRITKHDIRVKPIVNSSVVGDGIQYHKNVNIGIAVALEWGLIVPVVRQAENLSFIGLQRAITDAGERARSKKLKLDEVQGGTITITN